MSRSSMSVLLGSCGPGSECPVLPDWSEGSGPGARGDAKAAGEPTRNRLLWRGRLHQMSPGARPG